VRPKNFAGIVVRRCSRGIFHLAPLTAALSEVCRYSFSAKLPRALYEIDELRKKYFIPARALLHAACGGIADYVRRYIYAARRSTSREHISVSFCSLTGSLEFGERVMMCGEEKRNGAARRNESAGFVAIFPRCFSGQYQKHQLILSISFLYSKSQTHFIRVSPHISCCTSDRHVFAIHSCPKKRY